MRSRQGIVVMILMLMLAAVSYGLWATSRPGTRVAGNIAGATGPIADQHSLDLVRGLLRLPLTIDESSVAQDAFRLGDKEMDLAFADAVRASARQVRAITPEVRAIQARLEESRGGLEADQRRVTELAHAESTATALEKSAISDRLALARARAELDQDEVDDASQDLTRAGGDAQGRVQAIIEEHQEASKIADSTHITTIPSLQPRGFIGHLGRWGELHQKVLLLASARFATDSAATVFARQHDSLEHAPGRDAPSDLDSAGGAPPRSSATAAGLAHDSSAELLRITRRRAAEQKTRGRLDQHVANQRELSAVFLGWTTIVHDQQREEINHLLRAIAIILTIVLVGVLVDAYIEHVLRTISTDRRRTQTLCMVVRVALQVIGVLLVLLVVFGRPSNLGTVLGLAGAGLTVAMKDFIVSFFGWFVLLGKDGIGIGDLIEVNGVTGEVVELGMFHTVLLETGNWTDSGHPTGRRVTFTNSFAIERHYFNFTTSGQWLWDEVRIVVPAGRDPYPVVDALQKHVDAENAAGAERAQRENKRNTGAPRTGTLGAAPAINIKPIVGGIELTVRYLTHMRERAERRSSLYRVAIELLGEKVPLPA
ncbi:MAG: mechanosensitive ion channel family protein [Gemmatimonadota bacterium]|nr:mechanosensitive ion channel family protein [Gemmatimonadota bacterium]